MNSARDEVLKRVEETLESICLPGSQASIVSAGCVSRVIARDGRVSVVLDLPPDLAGSRDDFKTYIQMRLGRVDGIEQAQVLEKSPPPATTPASASPHPSPVVSGQGIPGVRHIVAVASGKGGVGKSTIAVNLAVELVRQGQRVGLLDSDVYGPSIPKMLGLEGAEPRATPDERLLPLEALGLKTMSIGFMLDDDSPVIWRGPMVTGLLRQFLMQVEWGELDYLILDLPPGTGDAQLTLVQTIPLAAGILVTTPQDVALLDVRRGLQMFQRVEVPIFGIVENMSSFECPECGHVEHIFSSGGGEAAARQYDVAFLGSIPIARRYALAGDAGEPMVAADPACALSQVLQSMARRLISELPA